MAWPQEMILGFRRPWLSCRSLSCGLSGVWSGICGGTSCRGFGPWERSDLVWAGQAVQAGGPQAVSNRLNGRWCPSGIETELFLSCGAMGSTSHFGCKYWNSMRYSFGNYVRSSPCGKRFRRACEAVFLDKRLPQILVEITSRYFNIYSPRYGMLLSLIP